MNFGTKFVALNKAIHDRNSFDCGEIQLNSFIQKQAAKHMRVGISKTMILPDTTSIENNKCKICAFYTIAPSSIKKESLPAKLAKKLPHYPVPVFLLAQMAIHIDHQRKGLGKVTLIKALEYLWQINSHMTAYAIVVDCLNSDVEQFYKKYGFKTLCDHNGNIRMYIPMMVVKELFL